MVALAEKIGFQNYPPSVKKGFLEAVPPLKLSFCFPKPMEELPPRLQAFIRCADQLNKPMVQKMALVTFAAHYFGLNPNSPAQALTVEDISRVCGIPESEAKEHIKFVDLEFPLEEWNAFEKTVSRTVNGGKRSKTALRPQALELIKDGKSQTEAARQLGVSISSFRNILNPRVKKPQPTTPPQQ